MTVKRKLSPPAYEPERFDTARLPDGRRVRAGDEVSVRGGGGRFRVRWIDAYGAVTCWSLRRHQMRTFTPDKITTVHRTRTPERPR